jgi:prepilin-type N-terminal cleavage/methylation domain-containing protein
MRHRLNQKGMTLIEIVIVLGIVGILAGSSIVFIGHIRYANTKKAAEKIDSALDKLQVQTISKTGIPYLYIYQLDDGYYMKVLQEDLTAFDSAKLTDDAAKLCNQDTVISITTPTETIAVSGMDYAKVAYTKSALFATDITSIQIQGNVDFRIKLVKETGKHFVE